jgi:hypothetical protein
MVYTRNRNTYSTFLQSWASSRRPSQQINSEEWRDVLKGSQKSMRKTPWGRTLNSEAPDKVSGTIDLDPTAEQRWTRRLLRLLLKVVAGMGATRI